VRQACSLRPIFNRAGADYKSAAGWKPALQWGVLLFCAGGLLSAETLTILPQKITLSTPQSRQQLIAELTSGQFQQDLTATTQWSSSNANIAAVSDSGLVTPVSDGEADITAKSGTFAATVRVTVQG